MQCLLLDVALLRYLGQVRRRIDVPPRAVGVNLFDIEMQVFPGRPCPRVARCAEPLSRLHRVADLHGNIAEMHVGTLHLAAVGTGILHRDGLAAGRVALAIDGNDLATFLGGKYRIALAPDVYPRVHPFRPVYRVLTHPERRGDKKKLLPFDRKRILLRVFRFPERVLFHAELLSPRFHLPHDLTVVLLQPVPLDDLLQAGGITSACGIARLFESPRPALVVVRGEREATCITAILFQETGVMLV